MRGSLRSPWQLAGTHTSCRNSRNTLGFTLPCELRPDSPAVNSEHSRALTRNSNGDLTSLRQHKRLPEFPIVHGEESQASCCNLRHTMRFSNQCEMRPFSPAAPPEQSRVPSQNSRGGLTPFMQLKGAQRSPSQLEMKPEFPATSQEEPRVSHLLWRRGPIPCFNSRGIPTSPRTTRGGLCHQLNLEWNPADPAKGKRTLSSPSAPDKSRFPCTGSNGTPSIPLQHDGVP